VWRHTVRPRCSRILDAAWADETLSGQEGHQLVHCPDDEVPTLLATAGVLRDQHKGRTVTYSRKVFLPITNLCRDRCSYCTFRKDPRDPDAWTMTPDEIHEWVNRGRVQGCKEALMCLGDKPEKAYRQYRAALAGFGHTTTTEYVYSACEIARPYGRLPHTNAGGLSYHQLRMLRAASLSTRLMPADHGRR